MLRTMTLLTSKRRWSLVHHTAGAAASVIAFRVCSSSAEAARPGARCARAASVAAATIEVEHVAHREEQRSVASEGHVVVHAARLVSVVAVLVAEARHEVVHHEAGEAFHEG